MASCKLGSYLYLMLCLSTQRIAVHCNIFKMSRYWGKQLKLRSSRPSVFKFVSFPKGRIVTNIFLTAVWVAFWHLIWQRRSSIGSNNSLVRFTSPCNRTLEPDFVCSVPFACSVCSGRGPTVGCIWNWGPDDLQPAAKVSLGGKEEWSPGLRELPFQAKPLEIYYPQEGSIGWSTMNISVFCCKRWVLIEGM